MTDLTHEQELELAWLAGFWEADGTLGIIKVTDGYQPRAALSQSMKETTLIDEVSLILKNNFIDHKIYDFLNRKYPQRAIYINRIKHVERFLKLTLPYIKGRKQQRAKAILDTINRTRDKEEVRLELKELSIRSYKGVRGGKKADKIPEKDYDEIKERYSNGERLLSIAKDYDVTKQAIWYVINKK